MRLFHLADLHLGRRACERDLLEDQRRTLDGVLREAEARRPDAVLLAGDVYDKAVPTEDAVRVLDGFLSGLLALGARVFLIGGNHDSPRRLSFLRGTLAARGLFIGQDTPEAMRPVTLTDAWGDLDVWMLPFFHPAQVRHALPPEDAEDIRTYDDAVRAQIARAPVDPARRNVLLTHYFVTAAGCSPERSASEIDPVGGLNDVNAAAFEAFDYVALGHLHGPQRVGRDTVRYAGSLLTYSASETRQRKSFAQAELGEKGGVRVELIPLVPPRETRAMTGTLAELCDRAHADPALSESYVYITLTDDRLPIDAQSRLNDAFPYLVSVAFAPASAAQAAAARREAAPDVRAETPETLFRALFQRQTGREPDGEAMAFFLQAWREAGDALGEEGRA